jgi:chemotaxis protein methyltransferase CheR
MTSDLFRRFCEIAYERAGISLKPGKESLVSSRITKRLRMLRIATEREYLHYLENDGTGEEIVKFLDVISTNYTRFFREPDHFELLSEVITDCLAQGQRRFRIWCAASSTGEEPYSLAMTMFEAFGKDRVDFRLLATDISTRVLELARAGVYEAAAVDQIPPALLGSYFVRQGAKASGTYKAVEKLTEAILFRRLNLAMPPYPMRGPFDVVFCRNVMIYFDQPIRQGLIVQVERLLKPGGYLMIGHSETLSGVLSGLVRVDASVYRKPSSGAS